MGKKRQMTVDEFFSVENGFDADFLREADVEYKLAQIAGKMIKAYEESGMSYEDMCEHIKVKDCNRIKNALGSGNLHRVTMEALVQFCDACGVELEVELRKKENEK